ncbi:hypothetical protein GII33_20270 [Gordonia pseudamarae]|uniref:Uncharacterized protein n=1 Tax=Gordonia pseudamarae TaxID=2831662 RepID=A0ABX6ILP0_9ACTN|nr:MULTISPECIES: hypothetical protein [Gordonia]MBD0021845.1 hypothetical protein [Gordonia sp. (in: high G+C Gram-positive bacteria)]QHN27961.1 hypothetical protein GII33_20270 [Gordonia pseudamarae]QHN36819.1 hypothetical protein GII31_19890 [Gordonia pseudamarae]
MTDTGVLAKIEEEAAQYLSAGEWAHALAEYSVLREIRSRREGPYSITYLSNLHDCVRCMSQLALWSDSDQACRELHNKYVRTHGRSEAQTVDVAKHWAWALVHLGQLPPATGLYLMTADALWDTDPAQARQLLGAAAAYRARTGMDTPASPRPLLHEPAVTAALADLTTWLADAATDDDLHLTIDGLAADDPGPSPH